uniref:Uncharacterized protein n=1 Tax=Loa loa TaxID=7209 RepID=A0A1I7VKQ2_LOALO
MRPIRHRYNTTPIANISCGNGSALLRNMICNFLCSCETGQATRHVLINQDISRTNCSVVNALSTNTCTTYLIYVIVNFC